MAGKEAKGVVVRPARARSRLPTPGLRAVDDGDYRAQDTPIGISGHHVDDIRTLVERYGGREHPTASTAIPTPSTVTMASVPVRPERRMVPSDTMLWSRGSVTTRMKGWGGGTSDTTVRTTLSRSPNALAATISMVLSPGDSATSARNSPSVATLTAAPLMVTVAPGLVLPWTTTASLDTELPSAGPRTSRPSGGSGVGLAVGTVVAVERRNGVRVADGAVVAVAVAARGAVAVAGARGVAVGAMEGLTVGDVVGVGVRDGVAMRVGGRGGTTVGVAGAVGAGDATSPDVVGVGTPLGRLAWHTR